MHRPLTAPGDRAPVERQLPSTRYQPLVVLLVFAAVGIAL